MGENSDQLVLFSHQVAGHPNSILVSICGAFIFKPSLPLEIAFYSQLAPVHFKELYHNKHIPTYYGTVENNSLPVKGPKTELAIKLENLTHGFVLPNILDIKLGTQLYDPFDERLTLEKKAKLEMESVCTTSGQDGIRLTGFKVYKASTKSFVYTRKDSGKSMSSSDLINGIRRFFPTCGEAAVSARKIPDVNIVLPSEQTRIRLLRILRAVLDDVTKLYYTVEGYEWRVYGSSMLILYEGDENANPKHAVKLIDFAHARHVQGQGADEGMLKGYRTIIRLLKERLVELQDLHE